MGETIITCITQFITTVLTIGASVLVAYLTYCSQKKKSDSDTNRLQTVNRNSALELFNAYISNLLYFITPDDIERSIERNELLLSIEKMKLIEQYLYELSETELPDSFINDFQYYRLSISFQRLALESRLAQYTNPIISINSFSDLETYKIISSLSEFIAQFDSQKTEG